MAAYPKTSGLRMDVTVAGRLYRGPMVVRISLMRKDHLDAFIVSLFVCVGTCKFFDG